jgi:hypothetical protein
MFLWVFVILNDVFQVEDSYTHEALAAEERENKLRNELEQIQEQLLTSSHSLQDSKYVQYNCYVF